VPIKESPQVLEIGKAEVVNNYLQNRGRKVAFFALGNMQSIARTAAQELTKQGFDCALINPRFFKPIDAGTTEFFGRSADVVVTLEDHVLAGGYGSAVLELFSEKRITTPVVRVGWPDQFIEHASTVDVLRQRYGLTAANVVSRVKAEFGGPAVEQPTLAAALA
jgi:1-deoxy-D-xylulose-5-phosphate synthase